MTNRSMTFLVSSFLLALLLVTGIAGDLWHAQTTAEEMPLYAFLTIFSISSVPFSYWLRVRRQGLERFLQPDFLAKYSAVQDLVGQSPLAFAIRQDILGDTLEMLLIAQRKGRQAESAMADTAGYTAAAIDRRRSRAAGWRQWPAALLNLICCILAAQYLLWLEDTRKSLFSIQQGGDWLLFTLLLAFALLPWLFSNRIADQSWRNLLPVGCGLLYVALAAVLRYLAGRFLILQTIMNSSVNVIPNPLVLAGLLLAIPLLLMLRVWLPRQAYPPD